MGIGIGLQRKGRDMSKLKYLIDGKADEQFENMLWCFGGGDPDSDDSGGGAAEDIVTMGRGAPSQGGNVSIREELAMNQLIDDMDTEDRMAGIYGMDDSSGDRRLVNRDIENPMTTGFGPSAANPDVPANFFVGSPNLPPAVVTDVNGQAFNTTTGELIAPLGDPYDEFQSAMVPLNSAPVPTPPPPRYQTNAQKDFYENLAAQGDAAMNQFRAEVRNLDNRGLLGSAIASGIGNDGVPNFDASFPAGSQIRGVTTTNFVDLPVVGTVPISTYTGLDNPNAPADTSSDDNEVVAPVANPMTGTSQCPDGYTFDEDLQACRRKTKRELQADSGTGGGSSTASGDMFYRRTSLDDAPANLPGGFNFADANRNFTQSFAFRPGFYSNPMDTTGFTKLL